MSKTITLFHPIKTAAGEEVKTLTVHDLKRADIKAANKYSQDEVEQEDFLFSRMTGLQIEDLDQLHVADSKQISDAFRAMANPRDKAA